MKLGTYSQNALSSCCHLQLDQTSSRDHGEVCTVYGDSRGVATVLVVGCLVWSRHQTAYLCQKRSTGTVSTPEGFVSACQSVVHLLVQSRFKGTFLKCRLEVMISIRQSSNRPKYAHGHMDINSRSSRMTCHMREYRCRCTVLVLLSGAEDCRWRHAAE